MNDRIVGIQIVHNGANRSAGVPDLPYEQHAGSSLHCWCRPRVDALVRDEDGQIRAVRRS